MDYALAIDENGNADMTWDKADNIMNNIFLSLRIKKGSFFQNKDFGSRLHTLKKNLPQVAALGEEYAREALQWILDIGRAKTIEINSERGQGANANRLKLLIQATAADGRPLVFTFWQDLV